MFSFSKPSHINYKMCDKNSAVIKVNSYVVEATVKLFLFSERLMTSGIMHHL